MAAVNLRRQILCAGDRVVDRLMDDLAHDASSADAHAPDTKMKVFAHLAYGQDVDHWNRLLAAGTLVGTNEATPYGYGRAEGMNCSVGFSRQGKHGPLRKLYRAGLRAILGFDLVHAEDNAERAYECDVVWTHTESQFLAMAMVFSRQPDRPRPKLIGQSVWLYDKWDKLDPLRKAFYRRLVRHVDVLTVLSPLNRDVARKVFPEKRVELVHFGIATEGCVEPTMRNNSPHRVIALGNDRHRDWETAIAAFGNVPGVELKIFSTKASPRLADGFHNVEVRGLRDNESFLQEMAAASVMVLPLKANLHASGATVVQEAAIHGVPAVASRIGGIDDYFASDEVTYVEPGSPSALRTAVLQLLDDPEAALAQARRAQQRIRDGKIGAETYIRDHVRLSRELLDPEPAQATSGRLAD